MEPIPAEAQVVVQRTIRQLGQQKKRKKPLSEIYRTTKQIITKTSNLFTIILTF